MNAVRRTSILLGLSIALAAGLANAQSYEFRQTVKGLTSSMAESAPAGITDLSCGNQHCYAIAGCTIWSVGRNHYGQLGRSGTTDQYSWGDTG